MQHQMAVMGWSWGTVCVLVGGARLRHHDVEPNPAFVKKLVAACARFWRCVKAREEPPPTSRDKRPLELLHPKDSGETILELGEGLDYAEGFDVSGGSAIEPGSVLVIDPENVGELALATAAYDSRVAGIVAGANGVGSGVRLGAGQYELDVALAGRVYCNVDATHAAVAPGDLLTTSAVPGFAMKAVDRARAQGAILGKAMEPLDRGRKGQILVLVALQ